MVVEEIGGGVDGKSSSVAPQVEVIKPKLIVRGSTAPVQ